MIEVNQLAKRLLNETKVAVICHIRPDGDAIGSVLGLTRALNIMGVEAYAYCSDPIPNRFLFLEGASQIQSEIKGRFSAYVAVDCAEKGRLGAFGDLFSKTSNCYNIDHHVSNTNYAHVNYVGDKPSNCENVFELIKAFECEIDAPLANILATGIMTDTGNLTHKGVLSSTYTVMGELLSLGADINDIHYRMFSAQSKNRAELFGRVMSKIRYFFDGRFAVASVFQKDIEDTGAKRDETEGFIDFVMGIDGVLVGACIMEMGRGIYKISLRSKGADVNQVAGRFGGGGHKLASGCQIQGDYEEVVDKLRYTVIQYIDE